MNVMLLGGFPSSMYELSRIGYAGDCCCRSHGVACHALCCVRSFCYFEYRRILELRWEVERDIRRWDYNLNRIGNALNTISYLRDNPNRFSEWKQTGSMDRCLDSQWMEVAESAGLLELVALQNASILKDYSLACQLERDHEELFRANEERRNIVRSLGEMR